jgi:NitT/TauT family transport system substrate-binding protein
MSIKTKVVLGALGWLALITSLHAYLNVNWAAVLNDYRPVQKRKITVAYLPVTCQLTCPVTDYISKFSLSGEIFLPRMFQGFPEIKEALISNRVQAAFIVAPLALALKAQGVPIKIVYLGTAMAARWWFAKMARLKPSPICAAAPSRFPVASQTSACYFFAP